MYKLYVDKHLINEHTSLDNAMEWIEHTFTHANYLKGVCVFKDGECVFNGWRFLR